MSLVIRYTRCLSFLINRFPPSLRRLRSWFIVPSSLNFNVKFCLWCVRRENKSERCCSGQRRRRSYGDARVDGVLLKLIIFDLSLSIYRISRQRVFSNLLWDYIFVGPTKSYQKTLYIRPFIRNYGASDKSVNRARDVLPFSRPTRYVDRSYVWRGNDSSGLGISEKARV